MRTSTFVIGQARVMLTHHGGPSLIDQLAGDMYLQIGGVHW